LPPYAFPCESKNTPVSFLRRPLYCVERRGISTPPSLPPVPLSSFEASKAAFPSLDNQSGSSIFSTRFFNPVDNLLNTATIFNKTSA
jgi:hypothetical protein